MDAPHDRKDAAAGIEEAYFAASASQGARCFRYVNQTLTVVLVVHLACRNSELDGHLPWKQEGACLDRNAVLYVSGG